MLLKSEVCLRVSVKPLDKHGKTGARDFVCLPARPTCKICVPI